MEYKRNFFLFLLLVIIIFFSGCQETNKASNILKDGETYLGINGTSCIIEVDSATKWIIKDEFEDDSNYTIASVSVLDKKMGEYPVVRIVAEEIIGEASTFAKREGRDFIVIKDEEGIYFKRIGEGNKEEITKYIAENESKIVSENLKESSNYVFNN